MYDFFQAYLWSFPAAIALVASFIQSLTGFGFAIIATPLLITIYDPKEVVLILQIISLSINTVFSVILRKYVDWNFVFVLSFGSLLGQPIGMAIYYYVPSNILKIFISVIILLFLLIKQTSCKPMYETRFKSLIVGVISGLLNTSTALAGPPLILYLAACNREKTSMRADSIVYFTVISLTGIIGFIIAQQDLSVAVSRTFMMLPAAIVGLILGNLLFPYLSQSMFQKIIFIMMAFSSVYTIYSIL
ncbi:sulfite exporter TauE/SafE family protein [Pelosinus fermentans]|uniref:Probable membrane transporter protein n=1 Tax=Pelosinus fermentans JBW45 TaxID=1192197 RepID=I8TWR9_9FIRM|nr:sulfite exporter TauE/SafE family protein [Pelosinus fermentans]AJQ28590.1 protein of unknown function DUF81 [Pelosinus fermentans JBW45]